MIRIRRVLASCINADHPQRGMIGAFQAVLGPEQTFEYDYLSRMRQGLSKSEVNRELVQAAIEARPDWLWLQLQDLGVIESRTLREIRGALPKCVITHWMGDCRTTIAATLAAICREAHMTLVSNMGQLPMFLAAGSREARYLQIGLDWEEDVLGEPPWTPPFRVPDVVFCGGYYGESFPGTKDRLEACRALAGASLDFGVVSPTGWPAGVPVVGACHVKQQHHVWKRARVCINSNHFNDIELYYSDRQIISMASGKPLVCQYVPGLEREFSNGEHLLWYKSTEELVQNVRGLLADVTAAERVGRAGRDLVCAAHTWEHRIRQILPDVERVASGL